MSAVQRYAIRVPEEFRRKVHRINGVKTVVLIGGKGRPVVYFHGGGTFHGVDFARSWTKHFRVIAPYHPGYGESGDDPRMDSMQHYLLHYLALFGELGLERFDLVGISLGGWMAAEFAVMFPERVRRLVLAAPAGLKVPDHPPPNLAEVPREEILSYLVSDLDVLKAHLPRGRREALALGALMEREALTSRRIAPLGPYSGILENWVHRATMRTLLIWPKEDRILPVGQAKKWMRLLPNAKLIVIENAGHLVLDESKRARQAVVKFLS
jgi:pimeloyl-ACP methyl ester carboxylesterase